MAEPEIRYCTTADGVAIAYWTVGEGLPIVHLPHGTISHIQLECQQPEIVYWYDLLSARHTLVRYDPRGYGVSDRSVELISAEGFLRDLEAVVNHLRLERFVLYGPMFWGPIAVAYAARHPDRVSHLVLWNAIRARPSEDPREVALQELKQRDWRMFTNAWAQTHWGWSRADQARRWARMLHDCSSPEGYDAASRAFQHLDLSPLLPMVSAPTLVVRHRGLTAGNEETAQLLASRIPNGRLVTLEGALIMPTVERSESDTALRLIEELLGEESVAPQSTETPQAAAVHTILFTDLASSTALTQRLGDAKAQELVRAHNTIVREAVAAQGGSEIKHTGDGIMASFPTASGALECAAAIQRGVALRADDNLAVHIGLNAGEPVAEESDLFGTSVQLARRICDHASAGQILASNVVRELSAGKGFLFADSGDVALKGFEEPVRLYEVRWREED